MRAFFFRAQANRKCIKLVYHLELFQVYAFWTYQLAKGAHQTMLLKFSLLKYFIYYLNRQSHFCRKLRSIYPFHAKLECFSQSRTSQRKGFQGRAEGLPRKACLQSHLPPDPILMCSQPPPSASLNLYENEESWK